MHFGETVLCCRGALTGCPDQVLFPGFGPEARGES